MANATIFFPVGSPTATARGKNMVVASEASNGSGELALPVVKKADGSVFSLAVGESPRYARRMLEIGSLHRAALFLVQKI
ncbi:hypothetical protein [Halovenus sp. HT40]|uniref:hypothetical protein n=1 Tax=Halovenus sp. HT40 TaxID=3126691 RepID=UPI00300E85AD